MCSKASQPRHHIQAPRLITCCSAFKLQRIKAKIAKFASALLGDSIRRDSGLFGEVTGLDVTERKGSIKLSAVVRHLFEHLPLCVYVTAHAGFCACDIDHFSSTGALKVGDPPLFGRLALQISACVTLLICPPRRAIIPPLQTCADRWRLHWGVLDLRCTVGWRGTGSDRIRPDSLCAGVCLGAGKSYRYQRGFLGIFIFPTAGAMNLTTPSFDVQTFQARRFQVIHVYLSGGNLSTVGK